MATWWKCLIPEFFTMDPKKVRVCDEVCVWVTLCVRLCEGVSEPGRVADQIASVLELFCVEIFTRGIGD